MRLLVACEESQAVTIEMRALGIEAYSCDILPCSGGHPEWHIQGDVLKVLDQEWDMIIAFPPCTYLCVTGNKWMKPEFTDRFPDRQKQRNEAIDFFMLFANSKCPLVAIENPIGIISTKWRKPDQIIQPYYFGDPHPKKTCLWLKGLPKLIHTNIVEPQYVVYRSKTKGTSKYPLAWAGKTTKMPLLWKAPPSPTRSKERSKTFPGIAKAMAEQWGGLLLNGMAKEQQTTLFDCMDN